LAHFDFMAYLPNALKKISSKTPIGALLRSKDWARVPMALRETAQFSAGVESVRVLSVVQERMEAQLGGLKEQLANGKEATFDRRSFISKVRETLKQEGITGPADPVDKGGLKDITSNPRLGLIYDMQKQRAEGFAQWKTDQNEGALMLYPAQELVRIEERAKKRNWAERWVAAGGELFEGRMVALKTSPIWAKISRFGTPWPPFDWGSGMGLEEVEHEEAVRLGLLKEDEELKPIAVDFTQQLEASARGLDPRTLEQLKNQFGDQILIEGDSVRWNRKEAA
jgi:hypothetical protein